MLRKREDINGYVPLRHVYSDVCLSGDGQTFMFGAGLPGDVQRYVARVDHPESIRQVLDVPGAEVVCGRFLRDGRRMLALVRDNSTSLRLIEAPFLSSGDSRDLVRFALGADVSLRQDACSPDGGNVAIAASGIGVGCLGVALLDLSSGVLRRVEHGEMSLTPGSWSPDGRFLSVTGETPDGLLQLLALDVARCDLIELAAPECRDPNLSAGPWLSSNELSFLANGGEDNIGIFAFHMQRGTVSRVWGTHWDVEDIAYSASGGTLWWLVNIDGYSCLHGRRLTDHTELRKPLILPGILDGLCLEPSGNWAVARLQTPTRPESIVKLDLYGTGPALVLVGNGPVDADAELAAPERIVIPLPEDRETTAMLYRPARSRVFPILVVLHGGPEYQERPRYSHRGLFHWLARAGIGVIVPNIGGSTGYGRKSQLRVRHDWGGRDLEDVRAIHKFLSDAEWADDASLGLFGSSYGGYLAMWASSQDRGKWACVAGLTSPVNLVTFCRALPQKLRNQVLPSDAQDAQDNWTRLLERSPHSSSDSMTAPLLLVQGGSDALAPVDEAIVLVNSLKLRGVDARLVVLPDETHYLRGPSVERGLEAVGVFVREHLSPTIRNEVLGKQELKIAHVFAEMPVERV